jgi:S1-C subfamily serine protease
VNKPKNYRAEWVEHEGAAHPLRILDIDVIHDLAVVTADIPSPHFFALAKKPPPQGTRLFAFGNPYDIGISIVEGTYNGFMQDTLFPKIHFTGAINAGMSGGLAITASGLVVGINVQSGGNSIGFLVPVDIAAALLERTMAPSYSPRRTSSPR